MKFQPFFVFSLSLISFTALQAQSTNTWVGGFPGRASDWNCSRNWSLGHVPSEFDQVLIPDVSTAARPFPVIQSGVVEIESLRIESNAVLSMNPEAKMLFGSG